MHSPYDDFDDIDEFDYSDSIAVRRWLRDEEREQRRLASRRSHDWKRYAGPGDGDEYEDDDFDEYDEYDENEFDSYSGLSLDH